MQLFMFFGIIGSIWGNAAVSQETSTGGAVKEAVASIENTLVSFDKELKRCTPWTKLHEQLEEFARSHTGYSALSGQHVGQLKTLLLNIDSQYFQTRRATKGMCNEATPFFDGYVQLFDGYGPENADGQKQLLQEILQTGVSKSNKALRGLKQTIATFKTASNKLDDLIGQLADDYSENSEFFQTEVKVKQLEAALSATRDGAPIPQNQLNQQQQQPQHRLPQLYPQQQQQGRPVLRSKDRNPAALPDTQNEEVNKHIIADLKKKFGEIKKFYVDLKSQMDGTGDLNVESIENELKSKIQTVRNAKSNIDAKGVLVETNQIQEINIAINSFTQKCRTHKNNQ